MAKLRFEALKKLNERTKVHVEATTPHISQFFGENVFGMEQMRATLLRPFSKKLVTQSRITKRLTKPRPMLLPLRPNRGNCQRCNALYPLVPTYDGRNR
jgi:hypothetical protein